MTKFFIILLIIIGLAIGAIYYVKRLLRKFVSNTFAQFEKQAVYETKQRKEKDVIYEKDNIIVLKGESNNKN